MTRMAAILFSLLASLYPAAAQMSNPSPAPHTRAAVAAERVREYRKINEAAILREFTTLLAIPNVASDTANIQRNAALILEMLGRRGFRTQQLAIAERGPVIFAELPAPGAEHTVIIYAHYDGQPVDPKAWIGSGPFEPVLRTGALEAGGKIIPFPVAPAQHDDEWRIYARSSGDDKAPIVAILAALDALRANKIPLAVNLKLLLEGEEEAGSPDLERVVNTHRDLLAGDVFINADGPVDQSGLPLIDFGNRGDVDVEITVYGPVRPLHSGHYGNWAPNPAFHLSRLLASMKDAQGRVLVDGFYDDVVPLSPLERRALDEMPSNDAGLMRALEFGQPEGGGKKLVELINLPSLNIRGLRSAYVGAQSQNVVPDRAEASLDLRLVKNISPEKQFERLVAHIRKQGFFVTSEEPTADERRSHAFVARVTSDGGYPSSRTPMDLPVARAMVRVIEQATGASVVKMPTMGGSSPMYIFEKLGLPVIGLPIANYDNNQHSHNENMRLGNFWRAMDIFGALLADLRW
jgi:acetylornithine deacetylase/succinyl-diaminopimelate desuccinylase-like protein